MGFLGKLFGPKQPGYEISDVYRDMRDLALEASENNSVIPTPGGVYAFLMENAKKDFCYTLVAFSDGTLSVYYNNGGGTIGTGAWKNVNTKVKQIVNGISEYCGSLKISDEFPHPRPGQVSFHIVKVGGIWSGNFRERDLMDDTYPPSRLFQKGHEMLTIFRYVDELLEKEERLVFATKMGEVEMAEEELKNGADPNMVDSKSIPVCGSALEAGDWEILRLLLDAGADPNMNYIMDPEKDKRAPLIARAAGFNEPTPVQMLIDKGAHIDLRDQTGLTALHIASYLGYEQVVKLLIDRKANLELGDEAGYTPLMMAANAGKIETVRLLLDAGAEVNAKDVDESTPIMFAAQHGYEDVVRLLLAEGADPNAKGLLGMNAIDLANQNGHHKVLELMKEK